MTRFKEIAQVLKKARVNANLTQLEVSQKLGYGNPQFISNWERGYSTPPLAALKKVGDIYKIDPEILFDLIFKDAEKQMRKEFKAGKVSRR